MRPQLVNPLFLATVIAVASACSGAASSVAPTGNPNGTGGTGGTGSTGGTGGSDSTTSGGPTSGQTQATPTGPTGQWQLIFADEFNGSSLDTTIWHVSYRSGGLKGTELEEYLPRGVTVSGGALHLTAQPMDSGAPGWLDSQHPYSSGMIASWDKLIVPPGSVVEARARVPTGRGLWPAFWMLPQNGTWPPEIDILEVLGSSSSIWRMALHWSSSNQSKGFQLKHVDSSAWHTVTMQWDSTQVTWFIDGAKQGSIKGKDKVSQIPMYLVADLAIGGGWGPDPDSTTPFPATFDIDYIRVWVRQPQ